MHSESDAEHVFGLIFLASYFVPLEEVGKDIDRAKLYEILLFHDFGEIVHGDIVSYYKTDIDREKEEIAAHQVFDSLPSTLTGSAKARWLEYEEQKTPEAYFAYALDKMEPLFELLDPVNEQSIKRLKTTFSMHIGHKIKAVDKYPVLKRFTDVISEDMKARGIFWPRSKIKRLIL